VIDWAARAKTHLAKPRGDGTAVTDESRVMSVSSARNARTPPSHGSVSSVLSVVSPGVPVDDSGTSSAIAAAAANDADVPTAATARSSGNPYMTPEQGDRCHAGGWDDVEIATFMTRAKRFSAIGRADAEHLAERLALRDRQTDDRRLCMECGELEFTGRCAAARRGDLAGADRRLEPVTTILMRCPAFIPNVSAHGF
jgi:hypothetical protein